MRDGQKTFRALSVVVIADFEALGVARIADFEALGVARFADDSESKPRSWQNQKDYDAIMSLRHRGEYETKSSGSHPEINDLIDSL